MCWLNYCTYFLLSKLWDFLLLPERESNAVKTVEKEVNLNECEIRMDTVTAAWKKGTEPTLNGISLNMQPRELLIVVGSVGSGKTSLLMSVLGEIPITSGEVCVKGKISYASQEAWVFNATVKENILFGEEYQEDKYRKILHVTALEKDIRLFPKGDLTIVGERGIIMSGGQKARINLARCNTKTPVSSVIPALQERQCLESNIFLQDGATPHIAQQMKKLLHNKFGDSWGYLNHHVYRGRHIDCLNVKKH
ncbi:ATP-binding cassette sub-family C member 4-like [Centruroides vittatus]|uniref:ATP-binding cassette sub-family C member 4-like n=1 Tax=Centruroides vittatus TaxID=120091 RepID=UPI00350F7EF2